MPSTSLSGASLDRAAPDKLVPHGRQPVRRAVFTALLLGVMGAGVLLAPFIGLIGGIAFAFCSGGALTLLYKLTYRTPRGISSAYNAGAEACPACGSMQTDLVHGDGAAEKTCFSCDHRWAA